MPIINSNQISVLSTDFKLDGETGSSAPNVYKEVRRVSNSHSREGGVKLGVGTPSSSEVRGGKSATSMFVNKHTAKAVLNELVKLPASENTYALRLKCLKADCSIPSWHALTRDPERLKQMECSDPSKLGNYLAEPGVWLPEVECINTNVMMNLTAKLCAQYRASFQSLLLDTATVEVKEVSIVRGAPAAGKTSYLKGGFSLGSDEVKEHLFNRMPGVSMPQLHTHSFVLLDSFMELMEHRFAQGLTRDSLYLKPEAIENKLHVIALHESGQKVAIHDIQVDLQTLCCRMLKRSTNEPLMGFDYLSQSFRLSLHKRQETIDLVKDNHDLISEYSLSVWDGSKNVKVAERSADFQDIIIHDQSALDQLVKRDPALIEAEIVRVRDTMIDKAFIARFTAGLEPAIAVVFSEMLNQYDGKTIEQALELHRDRDHAATSIASRVLSSVVPG